MKRNLASNFHVNLTGIGVRTWLCYHHTIATHPTLTIAILMGTMPTFGILIGSPQEVGTVSYSDETRKVDDVNFAVDPRRKGMPCTVNKSSSSQNREPNSMP